MRSEYRTLVPYLKKYWPRYAAGFAALVAVDGAQVLIPRYVKRAVDLVASGEFSLRAIMAPALAMVGIAAVISAGRYLWRYFIIGASRRIETTLRDRLFAHILRMDHGFFQRNKTGDLMARATNDLNAVRMSIGMGFVSFVDGVFMSAMILVAMFASAPGVAVWTILPLPLIAVLIFFFGRMVGGRFKRVQEVFSSMSDIAQETMAGIRVVKAFVKEEWFAGKFSAGNDQYRDASMNLVKVFGFFFPLITFLSGISTVILLAAGGRASIANRMSPGDIVAMLSYLEMLIWPMMGAGFTVNIIQRGAASLKRLNEILDTESGIRSPERPLPLPAGGGLDIRNLTFTYEGKEKPALADISVSLERGRTLGILGRVGSGKSTLVKLLPRLIDPPAGTVFYGGADIRDYDLQALRGLFGFVPQDSFLFSESIRANILYGAPDLGPERFARIAAVSAIDRDIPNFPLGWDTVVGEKGLTLSGGQKQRVAIARALAMDPEILVLDDALSAVDAETEDRILEALLAERAGRTTVIISHRVSTLRHADLVVVLSGGRIDQMGTHEQLLARCEGFYAEIARLQELEATTVPAADGSGMVDPCAQGA